MGFVDGSLRALLVLIDDQGKPTTTLNPEYLLWNRKDQFVLGWINATLSDKVAPSVYGLNSARPAWLALANKFASPSRSRINHLKRLLQTLNQGSMKCAAYLDSAKQIAAQLGAIGKTIDDDDLIAYIVSGLTHSYHPFVTSLPLPPETKLSLLKISKQSYYPLNYF
ncbi:hypothetical protein Patl1_30349 [Pistacia atlantica]|uniref:Uncharacterized protein n=1 Tax=Pistacia atlantica TaxID=434234 RepID=A0ACC1AF65_9ROSI|nr:hypothetical protein Patl1_30349 [Pistacia atlantica]